MLIHIHDNLFISDLQERFSKCFQSLKIEFYKKAHRSKKPSPESDIIGPDKRIGEIRRNHNSGKLEIKSSFTAQQVENEFKKKFGLNVQIFRKENGGWVQTSGTDTYNLLQQSEMSKHADLSITPKYEEQLCEYEYL